MRDLKLETELIDRYAADYQQVIRAEKRVQDAEQELLKANLALGPTRQTLIRDTTVSQFEISEMENRLRGRPS